MMRPGPNSKAWLIRFLVVATATMGLLIDIFPVAQRTAAASQATCDDPFSSEDQDPFSSDQGDERDEPPGDADELLWPADLMFARGVSSRLLTTGVSLRIARCAEDGSAHHADVTFRHGHGGARLLLPIVLCRLTC